MQNIVDRLDLRKVLNRRQAAEMAGVSEDTVARLEKAGKFPASIRLSPRRVGYRLADVEVWLAAFA